MNSTIRGMVIDAKIVHPKNAEEPIYFTFNDIVTLDNPLQLLKTLLLIC